MNTQTRREIRFGLIALALSGLLFMLGVALRGPVDPDPESFLQAGLSSNFVPGLAVSLIGVVIQIYGLFGLYRYLTYQRESLIAFLAVMLCPLGIVFVLPLVTFLAVNVPVIAELYQQGNQAVVAVVQANFTSILGLALLGVSSIGGITGTILFAVAIWRDGRLPKWTGLLFGLSGLLLGLSGAGFFATELLGTVLLLISAGMMAWKGWQESVAGAAAHNSGQLP